MNNPGCFKITRAGASRKERAGQMETLHGRVSTPVFMPVASQGSVKALAPDEIRVMGTEMILANMYHLYLRPGIQVIEEMGGLHRFMGWTGAILTDSGGYQVFSLARLGKSAMKESFSARI
jgi:queuine tRNA-ribosyltransferase